MIRFYFWIKTSTSDRWEANHRLSGYESMADLLKDCEYSMGKYSYRILKAEVVEEVIRDEF